jgi:hypothetical protein
MQTHTEKIDLKRNPFVDVRLAVIASIAKLDSFEKLALEVVKAAHASFQEELLDADEKL